MLRWMRLERDCVNIGLDEIALRLYTFVLTFMSYLMRMNLSWRTQKLLKSLQMIVGIQSFFWNYVVFFLVLGNPSTRKMWASSRRFQKRNKIRFTIKEARVPTRSNPNDLSTNSFFVHNIIYIMCHMSYTGVFQDILSLATDNFLTELRYLDMTCSELPLIYFFSSESFTVYSLRNCRLSLVPVLSWSRHCPQDVCQFLICTRKLFQVRRNRCSCCRWWWYVFFVYLGDILFDRRAKRSFEGYSQFF